MEEAKAQRSLCLGIKGYALEGSDFYTDDSGGGLTLALRLMITGTMGFTTMRMSMPGVEIM